MSKFRVGQKVKVIQGGMGVNPNHVDEITTITETGGRYGDYPAVKTKDFENAAYGGWIAERSFESVETEWDD